MIYELHNCLLLSLDGIIICLMIVFHTNFSAILLDLSLDIDLPVTTYSNEVMLKYLSSIDSFLRIQCMYLSVCCII